MPNPPNPEPHVRFHVLAAVLLLGSVALPAPAPLAAQEPPDTVEIEPLTVSILRDLTERSAAAYAVSAADVDDLRLGKSGAFLEEALDLLPGVQVQNRFNFAVGERLSIRGFGPRAQFGVRGVQVLVDGIPATMPDGQSTLDHLDLASLGRAEILRGPASALYGNAAGGVLTLHTERPTPGPVRPNGRIVVGSDGLLNANGGVRGFVGEHSLMANAAVMRYDGFRAHPTEEGATYGAADRALFNGQYATRLGTGSLRATLNAVTLDAENPGSIDREALSGDRSARGFNVAQGTSKQLDQGQLGLVWDGALSGGRTEVALWGLGRSLTNPIPGTVIDLDRRAGGVRGIYAGSGWGAGVEVGFQHDDRLNFENEGGAERGALTLDQTEDVRSTGLFVRGELGPAEGLTLTGALRYDHFRFEADDDFVQNDPDDSGSRTMDAWSPTAGATFETGPVQIWANVSTALETPTTTELANRPQGAGGFNPDLDPARSTSLEAGIRGRLADALTFEAAAFHVELEDELVPFEVPQNPGRVFFRNAGRSEHDGVELSLDATLGSGLEAQAVYSHIDARFEEYAPEGNDVSGNRVPGLAPNRFESRLSQERTASGDVGWFWAVEGEWVDALPVDDANSESTESYWLANLRLGLRDVRAGGLVASPYVGVSNLFDELYTAAVTVNAFGDRFYEPGPGRTAYVALSLALPG